MAHKTVYRDENLTGQELELTWSEKGIHFNLLQSDGTYITSLVFDDFDIQTMIEEMEIYLQAIEKEKFNNTPDNVNTK